MSKLIESLTEFLNKEGIYPISKLTWDNFEINHVKPEDDQDKKEIYNYIKNQTGYKGGIYIYERDGLIIYVGKAKLLFDRLKSHYIESFQTVPGDTKDQRWHRFFSNHCGILTVYWKDFNEENERQIIELLLTKMLNPTFLRFR